jgi:predicted XRE-type DNA-binding protein
MTQDTTQDMTQDATVTPGGGNVFADLGFDNPEEELLKAKLVREIRAIIKLRRLTRAAAAELMGLKQLDVSAITTGRAGKFSLERLARRIDKLDYRVDLVARQKPRAHRNTSAVA